MPKLQHQPTSPLIGHARPLWKLPGTADVHMLVVVASGSVPRKPDRVNNVSPRIEESVGRYMSGRRCRWILSYRDNSYVE